MTNPDQREARDAAMRAAMSDATAKEYKGVKLVPDASIPPGEFHMKSQRPNTAPSLHDLRSVGTAELAAAREQGRVEGLREAAGMCVEHADRANAIEEDRVLRDQANAIIERAGGAK